MGMNQTINYWTDHAYRIVLLHNMVNLFWATTLCYCVYNFMLFNWLNVIVWEMFWHFAGFNSDNCAIQDRQFE